MSHEQTQIHKTHHGPDSREATTFPLIVYSMCCHETSTQMSFCQTNDIPKVGTLVTLGAHNFCADLWLRWGLKKSYSPCQDISNGMSHSTCTKRHWGDFQLLVVRSQIVNLTLDPSFGHNLCFKCPNGSCEPILDIYIPRDFLMI